MKFTISNSQGGHSEEHSRRSYSPFSSESSLTKHNIVVYDCGDDREHLNRIAEPYIRAYNMKQKRKDRMKDYEKDYVAALEDGRACYGTGEQREKAFHHDVIQIGNHDNLGVTDKMFNTDYWRSLKRDARYAEASDYVKRHLNRNPDVKRAIMILKQIAEEIRDNKDDKYSHVLVHGLTIHVDEPGGTPHLDFRYSIFTDNEKKGLPWRISDHKGLQKMGYETTPTQTALQAFRESVNSRIEVLMRQYGWEREYKNEHRKHLTTAQYEAEQRLKQAEELAENIVQEAKESAEIELAHATEIRKEAARKKKEAEQKIKDAIEFKNQMEQLVCSEIGQRVVTNQRNDEVEIYRRKRSKRGGKICNDDCSIEPTKDDK
ncbi:MAG: hypothetical protein MJ105_06995 [Lachnospiraceae bacterium]|nr:hypothetical protein [Lachnospiraceae bacterium]